MQPARPRLNGTNQASSNAEALKGHQVHALHSGTLVCCGSGAVKRACVARRATQEPSAKTARTSSINSPCGAQSRDTPSSPSSARILRPQHFKQGELALESVDSGASTKDTAQTAQLQRDPKAAGIKAACARSPLSKVTAHAFHLALKHIAGAQDAKAALQHTLLLPLLLPPEWLRGARQAPTALLLTGPPGTGKSSLMQAAAEAVGAACIFLSPSDVLSRYTGGSEGSLSRAFAQARAAAATSSCSVLCIDELDSIAPRRSACDAVAPARLVCQLLLELDTLAAAVGQQRGHRTVLLAATNRPEAIDPAVLRRMRVAAVPLPDTDQRASIVTASLQAGNTPHCITPEHARALATATQGCSGADVAAMVRYAAWLPLQEALASAAPGSGPTDSGDGEWPIEPPPVLPRHLTAAQTWFRTSQQAQGAVLNQAATVPRQAERDALSHSTEGAPNAACTAPCT